MLRADSGTNLKRSWCPAVRGVPGKFVGSGWVRMLLFVAPARFHGGPNAQPVNFPVRTAPLQHPWHRLSMLHAHPSGTPPR
eukprot:17964-Pyramimonas_sp.AAC.1